MTRTERALLALSLRAELTRRAIVNDPDAAEVVEAIRALDEGITAALDRVGSHRRKRCACLMAKRHPDCAYCGCGGDGVKVCGVCHAAGIDGPVIRGTSGRRCFLHARGRG